MEFNTNTLGQMIATIITEISKGAGGIPNLSRPSNSVNNGQMGQPHVVMDLEENQSHLHRHPDFKKLELNAALAVIRKTMKLNSAVPFNKPVDPVALGVPDYFDVIHTPMDFGTICNNLKNGVKYKNASDVFKDVQWIWYNCLRYNKEGDQVLELMKRVKTCFMKHWEAAGLDAQQAIVDDHEANDEILIRRRTKKQAPRLVVDENVQPKLKAKESTKVGKKKFDVMVTKANVVDGKKQNKGKEKMTKEVIKRKRTVKECSELDEQPARKSKVKKGNKLVVSEEGPSISKRHIRIRTSPKPLSTAMQSLTDLQKECLEKLGFASFIRFRLDSIPWKLGYFVVDCFNEQKMEMKLKHGVIKVTKYSVFEMLGLSLGGNPIESLDVPEEEDEMVENWRKQFERKEMTTNEVMKKIVMSKAADRNFILNFLVLFVNTMGHSFTRGKCDLSILRYITKDTDLKKIDWCDYIFNCVKSCKRGWRKDDENSFFAGPITLLTLLYVDNTVCKGVEVERSRPVLVNWTSEYLKQREAAGNFWEAKFAKQYIPSSEVEIMDNPDERREKQIVTLMEAEPLDVQVSLVDVMTESIKQREAAGEVESIDNHDEQRGKESVNTLMKAEPCDVQASSEVETMENHDERRGNESVITPMEAEPCDVQVSSEVETTKNHDERRGKESVNTLMEAEPCVVQVSSEVDTMENHDEQRDKENVHTLMETEPCDVLSSEEETTENHDEQRGKVSVNTLMEAEPCDVQVSSEVETMENHDERRGKESINTLTNTEACDVQVSSEVETMENHDERRGKESVDTLTKAEPCDAQVTTEVESMDIHDERRGKESVNKLMEAEPCDVQGYVTRMETLFHSIIADKTQLLKTVKNAMLRFPKNSMLEDWDAEIIMLDDVLRYMHENLKGKRT